MDLSQFNSRFKTDPEKEVGGVEVHIAEGFFVTVARFGNRKAMAKYRELLAEPSIALAQRSNTLGEDQMERIVNEVRATCILVGWRGLTEDGKEVPYSHERSRELLRIPDFAEKIRELSETQELFRQTSVAKAAEVLGKA